MLPILLNWQAGNNFGWGIAGLNLFFHWALSEDVKPIMGHPIGDEDLAMIDPLSLYRLRAPIAESNRIIGKFQIPPGQTAQVGYPVVHPLGNLFAGANSNIYGAKNIGRIVIEDTNTFSHARDHAPRYDLFVCVSTWNANLLRQACSTDVVVNHEGIDPSVFFPGPRSGLMDPGKFYIFSGGKIEYRKAQDIVLPAFREFSAQHPDAVLVTNWHSPWPSAHVGFRGNLPVGIEADASGRLNVKKWAADNGVNPERLIDIGPIPNQMVPAVLREMDCAVFPSRCEGGTNFVAMEAMACGVPVVLARNTGALDIIEEGNCLPLKAQSPVTAKDRGGIDGWGETDPEELVHAMQLLYDSDALRRELGAGGASFMSKRTWKGHSEALKNAILRR
jgi:glycosyltransferase involved in cell wall biosynthesis